MIKEMESLLNSSFKSFEALEHGVYARSQALQLPYRKVILKDKWWEKGHEPLLVFDEVLQKPMYLIPKYYGGYDIHEKTARHLHEKGFCFYETFPKQATTFKDLAKFAGKGTQKEIIFFLLLTFFAAAVSIFPLFALQWLIDDLFFAEALPLIWKLSFIVGVAAFTSALFLYLRERALLRLETRISARFSPALWNAILELSPSFLRTLSKNAFFQRIEHLEEGKSQILIHGARLTFFGCFALLYIFAMAIFSWVFTLISLSFLLLALGIAGVLIQQKTRIEKELISVENTQASFIYQSLTLLTRIRASGKEKERVKEWNPLFIKQLKREEALGHTKTYLALLTWFFPLFLLLVIFILGAVGWHTPTMGRFFAFYLALLGSFASLNEFLQDLVELKTLVISMTLEEPILKEIKEGGGKAPGELRGGIEINKVTFRYMPHQPLLEEISLTIDPQEKIGLMGPSGSGRTTLVRLILGLETPLSGEIFFDGKKLSTLNLRELRTQVGAVFRTEGIFAASLFDNIDVGRNCTPENIEQALELSGFLQDIENLPMHLNTLLSEGGETLSEGEKQRLLIARALAGNPKILILDHALDCLDSRSQKKILDNLKKIAMTQIWISHDVEQIKKYVDRVVKIDSLKLG